MTHPIPAIAKTVEITISTTTNLKRNGKTLVFSTSKNGRINLFPPPLEKIYQTKPITKIILPRSKRTPKKSNAVLFSIRL